MTAPHLILILFSLTLVQLFNILCRPCCDNLKWILKSPPCDSPCVQQLQIEETLFFETDALSSYFRYNGKFFKNTNFLPFPIFRTCCDTIYFFCRKEKRPQPVRVFRLSMVFSELLCHVCLCSLFPVEMEIDNLPLSSYASSMAFPISWRIYLLSKSIHSVAL